MKKTWFIAGLFPVLLLLAASPAFADSPVTSTDFYRAYLDVDMVQRAADTKTMDAVIADFLSAAGNPIDIKAAVINALGWREDGDNAERYSEMVYGIPMEDLDIEALQGDELFVLGYLTAMDDYFNVEKASVMLQKSSEKLDHSFTVSAIAAIVDSQEKLSQSGSWPEIWAATEKVIENEKLQQDMRLEAVKIIVDYMSSYSQNMVVNPFAKQNIISLHIGDTTAWVNQNRYDLDFGRRTKPEVKDGQVYIPISPLITAMGQSIVWDGTQRKVTIDFSSRRVELWIGKQEALLDGALKGIDVPYISNSRTMVSLAFIEALGWKVNLVEGNKEVMITI